MDKKLEKWLNGYIKEKMEQQFRRGMEQGAYGIAGAISEIVNSYHGGDCKELIEKLNAFLKPALNLKNKAESSQLPIP